MDAVFETLAEPNRRRILDLLRAGELPSGVLGDELSLSQPNVSKHLRILREAELVSVRQYGRLRLYRLNAARLAGIDAWLAPYRRFWADKLDALEDHLDRETPQ